MANDVKLQEGHPVDENLRPLKVGGKSTALETAQHGNGARVNGNLEVTGNISGNILDMVLEDLTVDSLTTLSIIGNDNLTLDAERLFIDGSTAIFLQYAGTTIGAIDGGDNKSTLTLYEAGGASENDMFMIDVEAAGATTIKTIDVAGVAGH